MVMMICEDIEGLNPCNRFHRSSDTQTFPCFDVPVGVGQLLSRRSMIFQTVLTSDIWFGCKVIFQRHAGTRNLSLVSFSMRRELLPYTLCTMGDMVLKGGTYYDFGTWVSPFGACLILVPCRTKYI